MRFPSPTPIPTRPCKLCRTPVQLRNLVAGAYGEDCAAKLGLTVTITRLQVNPQTGPTLLDLIEGEPDDDRDDQCDGWDRPADRDMPVRP